MSTFVFKQDVGAAESAGIGGITTGVFKGLIEALVFKPDAKGNPRVNIYFRNEQGKKAIIFGLCIAEKWLSGKENMDYKKWQELAYVAGIQAGTLAVQEVETKKDTKTQENCFVEATGKPVVLAIQEELGEYNGKETNDKRLYATFFENKQTISEKNQNVPAARCDAIAKSLKPYETKAYKTFKAGGGNSTNSSPEEAPVGAPTETASLI